MKRYVYYVLVAMLLISCNLMSAQNVLLPYGQDSNEPWQAKYYHALSGENIPYENWYAEDYDDSAWESLVGPISTETSTRLPYYESVWQDEYSTYWVRRHFTVNDTINNRILYLRVIHDDGCEAYLNGHLIYNTSYLDDRYIDVTESAKPYLKKGDNVMAVRVSDSGGLYAYMDFGLTGSMLYEPEFNSYNGWSGNYDRHGYDGNNIGYKYGRDWICQQNLTDVPEGLYRLSANACGLDHYDNFDNAYNSRENALSAKLFINESERSIPNAFSEIAESRIYDNYYWEVDGGYVPYYVDYLPTAFKRGMYQTQLFSYYVPDSTNTMNVGIRCYPENDIYRWASWDNVNLVYIEEAELATMLDSLILVHKSLSTKHQDKTVKEALDIYLAEAGKAKTYKEKGLAYANMACYEPTVRKTIDAYERLYATHQLLTDSLTKTSKFTSPATIAEATSYAATVLAAYNDGKYNNNEVATAISTMNKMMERLSYNYLDIAVNVPGSLGDSILAKVENFVDVYSLKVSGKLNDADIANIQNRLTNLREIDMTDLDLKRLPNRMFYQRKSIEIIKLPVVLEVIGEYAIAQCWSMKHIDLPESLITIEPYGLDYNTALESIELPDGITTLGYSALGTCTNLRYAKLPASLQVIEGNTFYDNHELTTVVLPEKLHTIGSYAFYDCYKLDNVIFPSSLYTIGGMAFAYNCSLSNVEFNEGLYQIADNAFYDCDALTEVTLPSTLVLANESPFDHCDNLRKVTCLSIEPPYMTDQIPYGLSMEGRELYVPALSINTYKQTTGWDKFPTIKPIDYLPENIYVLGDLHLTLPENIPANYKPNVTVEHEMRGNSYLQYGKLTVNGEGTLSMADYSMVWDYNYLYCGHLYYSNCFCSLINNSHLRADSVAIKLATRNDNRWTFASFPFDVKLSDIETIADGTTNWVIRKYDGQKRAAGDMNETWVKLTGDDVLNAGEGCIIQGSRYIGTNWQDYSYFLMKAVNNGNKNNIFRTDDITVKLYDYPSEFAHNRGWNFIGNPYPSFYDTRFIDYTSPITVWNWSDNTYAAYSPVDDSYILCPGEAFFVQRPVDVESIVFSKEGRQTDRNVRTLQAPAKAPMSIDRTVINLTLTDGEYTDRTRVVINDHAEMGYESTMDAPKFMSDETAVPQLFTTSDNVDYAINERPLADGQVSLSARFGSDGIYTIALTADVYDYDVILEDKLAGRKTKLTADSGYTFSAKAGTTVDRFVLYLGNSITGIIDIDSDTSDDDAYYTIDGIKVDNPTRHGIYIQKNKKVIVK